MLYMNIFKYNNVCIFCWYCKGLHCLHCSFIAKILLTQMFSVSVGRSDEISSFNAELCWPQPVWNKTLMLEIMWPKTVLSFWFSFNTFCNAKCCLYCSITEHLVFGVPFCLISNKNTCLFLFLIKISGNYF